MQNSPAELREALSSRAGDRGTASNQPHEDTSSDECRICLGDSSEEALIHPCKCQGTARCCHQSCLLRWAKERRELRCELCQSEYVEPYLSEFKQHLEALPARTEAEWLDSPTPAFSWQNVVWHVLILVFLLGIILYLTIFSRLAPSKSDDWTGMLWRVLTILIPAYMLLRMLIIIVRRWNLERRDRRAIRDQLRALREGDTAASTSQPPAQPPAADSSTPTTAAVPGSAPAVSAAHVTVDMPGRESRT